MAKKTRHPSVSVRGETYAKIQAVAKERHKSVCQVVEEWLLEALGKEQEPKEVVTTMETRNGRRLVIKKGSQLPPSNQNTPSGAGCSEL